MLNFYYSIAVAISVLGLVACYLTYTIYYSSTRPLRVEYQDTTEKERLLYNPQQQQPPLYKIQQHIPVDMASYKPAIASLSLGRAWIHNLPPKFTSAAESGLTCIEIFFEDLLYVADTYPGGSSLPSNQVLASHAIRSLCDTLNLSIMALGPFVDIEGLLDPQAKAQKMEELKLWFKIARILGTDIIQIPSTFQTVGFTGDLPTQIRDLRAVADLGAAQNPPFRFAYENLCFGTFNDTWEKAWAVVSGVDRPNFGLCLDTFNIAGRGWADPTSPDGKLPNADAVFAQSLRNMVAQVDPSKIFYVQVVDAEKMRDPLVKGHAFYQEGKKARMCWSRNARLFMCEEHLGGYLPVIDVLKAITLPVGQGGLGYKGWISFEFFNRSLLGEHSECPAEHAHRAVESWKRLVKVMGWEGKVDEIVPRKLTGEWPSTAVLDGAKFSARL